jgi:tetratricopeptide (TPR) repeat protein
MLETIRQFSQEQPLVDNLDGIKDRHARYFAEQAMTYFEIWNGPECRSAIDWVDVEFANLRAGFRWTVDRTDLATAAAIAAHASMLAQSLLRYEAVGWAEAILEPAAAADLKQLPRLYTAAAYSSFVGRPEAARGYAQKALNLEDSGQYDSFEIGHSALLEANSYILQGRIERLLEICIVLASRCGLTRVCGLCGLTWALPSVGRAEDARAKADEMLEAARTHGSPYWIAFALYGYGQAFIESDPARALRALREGLAYAQDHRLRNWEALIARDAARVEAVHGDVEDALTLFQDTVDSFYRAGDHANVAATLANLAVLFERSGRPDAAAAVYGASTQYPIISSVVVRRASGIVSAGPSRGRGRRPRLGAWRGALECGDHKLSQRVRGPAIHLMVAAVR